MSRTQFSKEFKVQVVKQILEEGKTATKVGKELELSPSMVARWVKEYNQNGDAAFSGSGNPLQNKDFDILKLKKRIEELEQEKEILKKFQAFLKTEKIQKEYYQQYKKLIHTDRSSQFIGKHYKDMLHKHGFKASMSRLGNPYDNAIAEPFHKTLDLSP